ncbi:hypothetical protein ACCO45_004021 [Purpureocillium lilacinum]|uniref:Uncharacterized protein n=1 Tax=Purpureocillium lilacinum TaxID=33203 RepID=A0ACC4E4P9_PURLI
MDPSPLKLHRCFSARSALPAAAGPAGARTVSEQYFLALSLRPYRSEVAPPPSPPDRRRLTPACPPALPPAPSAS